MKTILLLALLVLPFGATAQEVSAKPSPAETLLEIIHFEETIIESGKSGFAAIREKLAPQNLTAEEMAEVEKSFMEYMAKVAGDPVLKKKTAEAYEAAFTEQEIQDLIKFYRTPVGQKSLTAMPQITASMMQLSEQQAQKHVADFQKTLTGILQRKAQQKNNE